MPVATDSGRSLEIRPVTRVDRDEWARMREALYGNPPVAEIDEWLDAVDAGGTHPVGVAAEDAEPGALLQDARAVGHGQAGDGKRVNRDRSSGASHDKMGGSYPTRGVVATRRSPE